MESKKYFSDYLEGLKRQIGIPKNHQVNLNIFYAHN